MAKSPPITHNWRSASGTNLAVLCENRLPQEDNCPVVNLEHSAERMPSTVHYHRLMWDQTKPCTASGGPVPTLPHCADRANRRVRLDCGQTCWVQLKPDDHVGCPGRHIARQVDNCRCIGMARDGSERAGMVGKRDAVAIIHLHIFYILSYKKIFIGGSEASTKKANKNRITTDNHLPSPFRRVQTTDCAAGCSRIQIDCCRPIAAQPRLD